MPKSYKYEVHLDRQWSSNSVRFATRQEAEAASRELLSRWLAPSDGRVVESNDPVNYRFDAEQNRAIHLEVML